MLHGKGYTLFRHLLCFRSMICGFGKGHHAEAGLQANASQGQRLPRRPLLSTGQSEVSFHFVFLIWLQLTYTLSCTATQHLSRGCYGPAPHLTWAAQPFPPLGLGSYHLAHVLSPSPKCPRATSLSPKMCPLFNLHLRGLHSLEP